eukprot:scaffold20026_cov56-Phaeocystis_antarctica.AAC.3
MGDDREKHEVCPICVKLKVPTTYWCCVNCPGNPGAWKRHAVFHKKVKSNRRRTEDGGVVQQRHCEIAERFARYAAQSGDAYDELLADGARYSSKNDWRRAARAYREAIALRPDKPEAYHSLGAALGNSGHNVEAAQRLLEAKERYPAGSEKWAETTAAAFNMLTQEECAEVAKPEWWNDEELKALSARVVRVVGAAPIDGVADQMRAVVLGVLCRAWVAGPRSAAELMEAATHYERAAALCPAPEMKAVITRRVDVCRNRAESMRGPAPLNLEIPPPRLIRKKAVRLYGILYQCGDSGCLATTTAPLINNTHGDTSCTDTDQIRTCLSRRPTEGHVEAAQRFLEAKERYPVGSGYWAKATAEAFCALTQTECAEVAKPEWWNDEELKALSARVVISAPNDLQAVQMRAAVLGGQCGVWEAGPRSAAELRKAATHYARAAALHPAPAGKAELTGLADRCRAAGQAQSAM